MRTVVALCLLAALSISIPGAVHAQDSQKRARELVTLVMPREAYERSIQQMSDQMLGTLRAQGQPIAAGSEKKMKTVVMEVVPYDEMLSWTADIYARRFTSKELGELIAFYKTATGRKLARLLPELMGEVGTKLGQIMPQRLPAALKKHGLSQ